MKKFFSLFVCLVTLVACFTLSSCSKDDDSSSSSSIVGCWQYSESSYGQEYVIFKSNGTIYFYEVYGTSKYAYKASYEYNGSTLTVKSGSKSTSNKATVKGNTLTIYGEEDGEEYTETYTKTSQPITDEALENLCE